MSERPSAITNARQALCDEVTGKLIASLRKSGDFGSSCKCFQLRTIIEPSDDDRDRCLSHGR
jgi:hypothetical protein